ncbi:thiamine phosphate synthase [Nonlabens mediterrranea]|uniref:Thiamine phosphate synthase n=1 Tax=Nonlabens mediterrranea TaxID=1419947 RepID=A0ABS0A284_9FLAO|nr:thiamine phosphate synthase [Nonlabens mediterrranea]
MIPKLHYISQGATASIHLENVQKACSSGVELIQLDLQHIPENKRLTLATEVLKITTHFQTRLIIRSFYKIAYDLKVDGVYLLPTDSNPSHVRKQLYSWQSIGAMAHHITDCEKLLHNDVDYIVLGPFKSTTDPATSPLDLTAYSVIMDSLKTETPLLAYGDIHTADVKAILETGISGLVVSQAINDNFNHIKTFNQLLGASSTDEMRHSFK